MLEIPKRDNLNDEREIRNESKQEIEEYQGLLWKIGGFEK